MLMLWALLENADPKHQQLINNSKGERHQLTSVLID